MVQPSRRPDRSVRPARGVCVPFCRPGQAAACLGLHPEACGPSRHSSCSGRGAGPPDPTTRPARRGGELAFRGLSHARVRAASHPVLPEWQEPILSWVFISLGYSPPLALPCRCMASSHALQVAGARATTALCLRVSTTKEVGLPLSRAADPFEISVLIFGEHPRPKPLGPCRASSRDIRHRPQGPATRRPAARRPEVGWPVAHPKACLQSHLARRPGSRPPAPKTPADERDPAAPDGQRTGRRHRPDPRHVTLTPEDICDP